MKEIEFLQGVTIHRFKILNQKKEFVEDAGDLGTPLLEGNGLHHCMSASCPASLDTQVVGPCLQEDVPQKDIVVLMNIHLPSTFGTDPEKLFGDCPTGQCLFPVGSCQYGYGVGGARQSLLGHGQI